MPPGVVDNAMKNLVACDGEEGYGNGQALKEAGVVFRNLWVLLQVLRIAKSLVVAECVRWIVISPLQQQLPPQRKDLLARAKERCDHPSVDNPAWGLSILDGFPW